MIKKQNILFVCNYNAIRSPMAQGLAQHICGEYIDVDSVGIFDQLGQINSFSISTMNELGIDISDHKSKNISKLGDRPFDLVITLTPEAHQKVLSLSQFKDIQIENWPTNDPSLITGNRENIMNSFRHVRDVLQEKITKRAAYKTTS